MYRAGASTQHMSTSTGKSVLEYNVFSIFMFIILGKTSTRVVLAPALFMYHCPSDGQDTLKDMGKI